jgi:hypothetical protein
MSVFSLKTGLLVIGMATWFWGYRTEDAAMRWLGIAFLAVAFVLRLVGRRHSASRTDEPGGPSA